MSVTRLAALSLLLALLAAPALSAPAFWAPTFWAPTLWAPTFWAPTFWAPTLAWAEEGERPVDAAAQLEAVLQGLKAKDAETRVKAATEARNLQDAALTSPLTRLLSDKELGVRSAVIDALGARADKSARKKAASALAARLRRLTKHVADQPELIQVIEALGVLQQSHTIKALMDDIDLEVDTEVVRARLFAVAAVPHKLAIEALITFMAKGRRGGRAKHRDLADKALRYATGAQPHKENRSAGRDADRWRAWWRENEKTFRFDAVVAARAEAEQAAQAKAERQKEKRAKREARKNKPEGKQPNKPRKQKKPKKPNDGGGA